MVERLVKEIRIGLDNGCYISALTTALTLPDICGKAKYPKKSTTQRYKTWLKDHVCSQQPFGLQADPEVIYDLRCKLLHEGNPSINKAKYQIKKFALMVRVNSAHVVAESSCYQEQPDGSKVYEWYNINIKFLCQKICKEALAYYQSHKEQFDFFDYRITNTDDETARTFGLSEDMIEAFIKAKMEN